MICDLSFASVEEFERVGASLFGAPFVTKVAEIAGVPEEFFPFSPPAPAAIFSVGKNVEHAPARVGLLSVHPWRAARNSQNFSYDDSRYPKS
jgi:hypothetical protein